MKTTDKNERPDSLKYQWKLYGLVSRSDWATNLDKSVAYELIDNYMKPYGNTRASIGYLQKATGGARSRITASLRRLTERGPFDVLRKGSGTRPSEFRPKFELVSGVVLDTSSKPGTSGVETDTSSGVGNDTSKGASGVESDTESVLQGNGLQPTYLVGEEIDCAAASPPPGLGASAPTGPVPAQEGFDALWKAYDFPHKKKEARAAYAGLKPDIDRQALVASALAWRQAWGAQNKPGAPRKYLHTWLADECFDEEVPGKKFAKHERAAIAAAKPKPPAPANSNVPKPRSEWQRVEITESEVEGGSGDSQLRITMRTANGDTIRDTIVLENPKQEAQESGQKQFERLRWAVGLGDIEDTEILHGLAFERRMRNGKAEYQAIQAEAA